MAKEGDFGEIGDPPARRGRTAIDRSAVLGRFWGTFTEQKKKQMSQNGQHHQHAPIADFLSFAGGKSGDNVQVLISQLRKSSLRMVRNGEYIDFSLRGSVPSGIDKESGRTIYKLSPDAQVYWSLESFAKYQEKQASKGQ